MRTVVSTTVVTALAWVVALAGPMAQAAAPLPKAHAGKIWVLEGEPPEVPVAALGDWLKSRRPSAELAQASKEAPWALAFVAVFKRPALKGPMTVQFAETSDPKELVEQISLPNAEATTVFRGKYKLDPNLGFNKGRRYIIRVGQILNGKFATYASGEVALK